VSDSARIAVYYAPDPDSDLWRLASSWIGRDAFTGVELPLRTDESIVKFPRHYGFHATLKPPFSLRLGTSMDKVVDAAATFGAGRRSFTMPRLEVTRLGRFLAITEAQPSVELCELAADCVRDFEVVREPLTIEQTAARRKGIEDPRQLELIETWGYPYVFDQWKFHMTLTSSLVDPQVLDATHSKLSAEFAGVLSQPLVCDAICLFVQEHREAPFHVLQRFPFAS
jgi:hypothetical protein